MNGVTNTRGISIKKLEHVLLGEEYINKNKKIIVNGYHCNQALGDEVVKIENISKIPPAGIEIIWNKHQGLFMAKVRSKKTGKYKKRLSTFFNNAWSRQDVVDYISRLDKSGIVIHKDKGNKYPVVFDEKTLLASVNGEKTTYPVTRY